MSRGKKLLVAGVLGALTMAASVQAQQWIMTPADAQGFAKASFPEYLEGLTLSNDTDIAADIQRNLNWLDKAFQKRGFSTQQLANGAHPMLYAELGPMQPNRPTVLFLMHFDGQSVTASDWTSDPWKPTLKIKDARGIWMPQPNDRLMQPGLDPEWRVFGRSASDGKGVISVLLTAVDAIKSARVAPTVNIKVLLDSEAERGSPHLTAVVNQNAVRLKNDGVVIFNGAVNTNNKPVITFGYRGSIQVDMTVFGPDPAAHSGAFGNVIINPVQQLAALLAGLKDADGRVTLSGFYDRVKLTDDERKQLALLAPPAGTIESRYGVTQLEKNGPQPGGSGAIPVAGCYRPACRRYRA